MRLSNSQHKVSMNTEQTIRYSFVLKQNWFGTAIHWLKYNEQWARRECFLGEKRSASSTSRALTLIDSASAYNFSLFVRGQVFGKR